VKGSEWSPLPWRQYLCEQDARPERAGGILRLYLSFL